MPPDAAPRVVEQRRRRVPARRRERIAEGGPARRRPAREGEARLERVEGRRAGREERLAPRRDSRGRTTEMEKVRIGMTASTFFYLSRG